MADRSNVLADQEVELFGNAKIFIPTTDSAYVEMSEDKKSWLMKSWEFQSQAIVNKGQWSFT